MSAGLMLPRKWRVAEARETKFNCHIILQQSSYMKTILSVVVMSFEVRVHVVAKTVPGERYWAKECLRQKKRFSIAMP